MSAADRAAVSRARGSIVRSVDRGPGGHVGSVGFADRGSRCWRGRPPRGTGEPPAGAAAPGQARRPGGGDRDGLLPQAWTRARPLCDTSSISGLFTGAWAVTRLLFTARCSVDLLLKVRQAAVLTPPFLFLHRRRVAVPPPPPVQPPNPLCRARPPSPPHTGRVPGLGQRGHTWRGSTRQTPEQAAMKEAAALVVGDEGALPVHCSRRLLEQRLQSQNPRGRFRAARAQRPMVAHLSGDRPEPPPTGGAKSIGQKQQM